MSSVLIKVPPLGESVSEATVSKWYKKSGDSVSEGDVVLELETDKVTLEVNAPASGVIDAVNAEEGSTVSIGDTVGSIAEGQVAKSSSKEESFEDDLKKVAKAQEAKIEPVFTKPTHEEHIPQSGPATRKMMEELGLSGASIQGTGKGERITKEDVINHQKSPAPAVVETRPLASVPPTVSSSHSGHLMTRKTMTPLRRKIAERLKHAQNTAAILTTFNECDMSVVMELRKTYQDQFVKKYGTKLGFMSFFVKACVEALKEIPAVNGEIDGEDMIFHHRYDIGVAVSAPQGLVVPVLRNADQLGLHEIEMEIAGFGEKAKANKLSVADLTGGTFTISNGGTFGSLVSTPILNPPQSGILGMHKIEERPVVVNGQIVIRPMMYLALSYDHRIIDGREAVTFLVKVKEYIENPTRMLLGI